LSKVVSSQKLAQYYTRQPPTKPPITEWLVMKEVLALFALLGMLLTPAASRPAIG